MIHMRQATLWLAAIVLLAPVLAEGQAYCSLRDPNRIIQEIYPDATGFRSFLRKVTRANTEALKEELALEFDPREFTTHTLYAVHQDRKILGYVQSRTEAVEWGLAEIIWVLDADLKLASFRFQRCRSRWKDDVENEPLQALLKGLSGEELLELWREQGLERLRTQAKLPTSSSKLIEAVVKSGLKATGLARVVWGNDIENIRNAFASSELN